MSRDRACSLSRRCDPNGATPLGASTLNESSELLCRYLFDADTSLASHRRLRISSAFVKHSAYFPMNASPCHLQCCLDFRHHPSSSLIRFGKRLCRTNTCFLLSRMRRISARSGVVTDLSSALCASASTYARNKSKSCVLNSSLLVRIRLKSARKQILRNFR